MSSIVKQSEQIAEDVTAQIVGLGCISSAGNTASPMSSIMSFLNIRDDAVLYADQLNVAISMGHGLSTMTIRSLTV
jgi:hypothetical protein